MTQQQETNEQSTPVNLSDETAVAQELAKSEDISTYVEEREEQTESDDPEVARLEKRIDDLKPEKRKASRYERLKRARDAAQAEAEELRSRIGQQPEEAPAEDQPSNPYDEEIEQGRREAEYADQMAARDEQIALQTECRMRADTLRQHFPDFDETIASVRDVYELPPEITQMMMRSPYGAAMAYAIAKDAWAENSQGYLAHIESLAGDPIAQARAFGAMEQAMISGMQSGQTSAPPRATQAPPPMKRISGGSSAPKDIHSLAASDDVSAYVKARRGNG